MKKCPSCGEKSGKVEMRSWYEKRVEIRDVPVFECQNCDLSEIAREVRVYLRVFINHIKIGQEPVSFADYYPVAWKLVDTPLLTEDLLDMYLLVKTLNDPDWLREIESALLACKEEA